jgi:spore maturation protein SpmA
VDLFTASGVPPDQDVVTAVTGASAALVGFLLVFLGALVAAYQSGLGQLRQQALQPLKVAGWATATVFLIGLATLALGIAWLAAEPGDALYKTVLGFFASELAGLTIVALYTTWRLLLR